MNGKANKLVIEFLNRVLARKGEQNMAKKLKPDMKPQKRKLSLFESVPELSGPIINLCSNREASVDGCRGVVDYYDDRIKLSIKGGSVTFYGQGLYIASFTESSAEIRGSLQNIEFQVR